MAFLFLFLVGSWLLPPATCGETQGPGVTAAVEAARGAGIPDAMINRILTASLNHRISANEVGSLLEVLRNAWAEELPLEPFVGKIEEGLAKRTTSEALVSVLEQRIEDYRFVQELLRSTRHDGTSKATFHEYLTIIVNTLSEGLSRQELKDFIEGAPSATPSMLGIAAENLALLNQIEFDKNLASQILFTGLRLKCFTPSWRHLARVVAVARNRGMSDQDITKATVRAMRDKRDLKELMTALGFTGRDLRRGPTEEGRAFSTP